ncbi:MAG: hypothetical protein WCW66_00370 [Patescibacteria group bacterium]
MAEYSDKQLKISIWWVTHRYQLKKWWVILIAVADLMVFLYILFNVIILLVTWTKFTTIPSQIGVSYIDFGAYQQTNSPQAIQVINTSLIPIPGQVQKYNLIAEIKNPNAKWVANSLVFHFVLDGVDLDQETTFLLPQEQRYVFKYAVKSTAEKPIAKLVVDAPGWVRVDFPEKKPAINFEVTDIKTDLIPILGERGTQSSYSTRVTAMIKNNTVYNFWNVKFLVVLYSGNLPVAVNEAKFDRFAALESRELGLSWGEEYGSVTSVKVVPEVNAYDPTMLYSPDEF